MPKLFIPFLALMGIILGEVIPLLLEPDPNAPGAKVSMFSDWMNFIATVTVYSLLGWLFWWLYRRFHWLIVAGIAAVLGAAMEFSFMRLQEARGPNVVEDPWGALLFFIVVWPILMVLPHDLFQLIKRLIEKARTS